MSQIPDNVRLELIKLVPSSLIKEIACFVFYDDHPRDKKRIDITICTKSGDVREYYKRDLLFSLSLDCISMPRDIRILRNGNSSLFYLVGADDELFILSRKEKLVMHQKVTNVDRYDVDDSTCSGLACLKVVRKDDAVPLVFDDNFENLGDRALLFNSIHADDSLPILTHLMRKLTEAKYSVKCNEKTHKDLVNLRQVAAFSTYQKIHPNLDSSVFKKDLKEITGALKIKTQTPWVKTCNNKIVIVLNVTNKNDVPIDSVQVLLHGTTRPSITYKTKLFQRINISPFWREKQNLNLKKEQEIAVAVVMDLKELKNNITSSIEFNGVIVYNKSGKEFLLPFENVVLSSMDTMGEDFDVLSGNDFGDCNTILAILATTEKADLILRHIKNDEEPDQNMPDVFCTYLQMEKVPGSNNIVVHRKSPYHILNGTMIMFHEDIEKTDSKKTLISVATRCSSQVLAVIHYIQDAVPLKIIITTPNQRITAKDEQLSDYNEDISSSITRNLNYVDYSTSILKRTTMLLEYLDDSMIKMNESKNLVIKNKVGSVIDLFAGGVENYIHFRNKMLDEALKGINILSNEDISPNVGSEDMIID